MLDSLIHELNLVRSVLGEPDSLDYVEIRPTGVTAALKFGEVPCVINWIDLPGFTRYRQEFSFIASDRRLTLAFPSPFLRNAPATLEIEGGVAGETRTWHTDELASYESAFKRELVHFHECVTEGAEVKTTGLDGLRDIALCQSFIAGHVTRQPVVAPTETH
jgi:predicted dehydrogenase